jgi:hypothetical protein
LNRPPALAGLLLTVSSLMACHQGSFSRADRTTTACRSLEVAAAHTEADLHSGFVIASSGIESICAHELGYKYSVLAPAAIQRLANQRRQSIHFLELTKVTVLSPKKVRTFVLERVAWPAGSTPPFNSGIDGISGTEIELTLHFGFWWRSKIVGGFIV